jgi:hypothetical protein
MAMSDAYIVRYFLPWSQANAQALAAGAGELSVDLPGGAYVQAPQKYHAKSLAVLRAKYAEARADPGLRKILESAGAAPFLT